jgi:hypothetical protein
LKKFLLGVIILIVFAGAGAYVYTQGAEAAKPGLENYVVEDTDIFVYVKDQDHYKDLEKRYTKALEKFAEATDSEVSEELKENMEQLKEFDKYVKDLAIVHTAQPFKELSEVQSANVFVVLNVGANFDLAKPFVGNMFDKTEKGNYILKNDVAASIKTPEVVDQVGDFDVYMKMADRYFILGFDEAKLDNYYEKVKSGSRDKRIIEKYNKQKKDIFEIYVLVDGKKLTEKAEGALPPNDYIKTVGDIELYSIFKNKTYQLEFAVEGEGKAFELIDSSQLKNRKLGEYLTYNSLYFSNNDLGKTLNEVNEIMKATTGMDYNMAAQMFTGHTLAEITEALGNEVIVSLGEEQNISTIVDLKDTAIVTGTLEQMQMQPDGNKYNLGDEFIIVDDKKVFYNRENEKSTDKIAIESNDFLMIPVDLGKMLAIVPEMQLNMMIASFAENLKIQPEELKEALKDVRYQISMNGNGKKVGFKMAMADEDIKQIMNYVIKVLEDSSK